MTTREEKGMMVIDEDTATATRREGSTPVRGANGMAFHRLTPTSPAYATLPILEGFTWGDCVREIPHGHWYLVVFRSIRRADADAALLTEFDDHAHAEALVSGGLLHYFKGELGPRHECLSFCVWTSREQARLALHLPRHQAAARLAAQMYETYTLERYQLIKRPGSSSLELLPV
jgi:hypothetical protein